MSHPLPRLGWKIPHHCVLSGRESGQSDGVEALAHEPSRSPVCQAYGAQDGASLGSLLPMQQGSWAEVTLEHPSPATSEQSGQEAA